MYKLYISCILQHQKLEAFLFSSALILIPQLTSCSVQGIDSFNRPMMPKIEGIRATDL